MINYGKYFFLLLILAGMMNLNGSAQLSAIHDYKRNDNVLLISENSDTLLYPFAGGLNNCQFMNMDVNFDGVEDIVVFDRHGNRILPFIVSSASSVKYQFAPELSSLFPPIEQWMQALDYNHDGRMDIFTYTTGGVKVYRNDSQSTLKFTQVTHPFLLSQQGTTLTNILVTYADYPAIADVDNDGDLDILTFRGLGSFVDLHLNTSVERFGNPDSLTFEKVSSCWGHFAEGNEDNTIILDTCSNKNGFSRVPGTGLNDPKHTGSTMLLHDFNADGLPDITLGDVDFSTLIHLTNGGTLAEAKMVSQTTLFPNATNPVSMNSFPAAMLVDVNNDGVKDLLVSPFDPALVKSENYKSVSLYINEGTNQQPVYDLVTKSFLQEQMLDLGSGAYPVFFDYNADGLMDLLIGNYGYLDTCIYNPLSGLSCTYKSQLALMLNTGTSSKPQFTLVDRNIAHLDTLQMQSLIPALADMDADGDADLVCGNSKGKLVYCENIALPGQPANFIMTDPAWHGIDVGDFSAPQLIDMDGDGLTDLICGKRNGALSYYNNTGTPQVPVFSLVTESFGGVDVTNPQLSNYGYSVPCFYQDKSGETVLFAGSEFGAIYVYDQVKNNLEGNFRLLGTLPGINEGWRSSLALGNLNNDTLADMLVGNYSGGLGLFFGKEEQIFGIGQPAFTQSLKVNITPNPAQNKVSIDIAGLNDKNVSLLISRMDGKIVWQKNKIELPQLIDIKDYANGIYLVSLYFGNEIVSGILMVVR